MNAESQLEVRPASLEEAAVVSEILTEAAEWLRQRNIPMWRDNELTPESIGADVAAGLFFIGRINGEAAGVVKFQLEDRKFWPDMPEGEAAFVHRLAIRRRFAGGEVSAGLLDWAVERVRGLGRRYVRLDCDAARTKLRALYERFGFRYHSEREVPPYVVSRFEYEVNLD